MLRSKLQKILLIFLITASFFTSCASTQGTNTSASLQTLSRQNRLTLDSLKNNLYTESLSYASRQLKTIGITKENLFGTDSPIYKNKDKIPLFEIRMDEFTAKVKTALEESVETVSKELLNVMRRYNVNNANFNYFYEETLSFTEESIKTLNTATSDTIGKVLDESFKANGIYDEWAALFKSYDFWKSHFDNIAEITGIDTYEKQNEVSLLAVTTEYMKNAFIRNLRVGERITKETQIGGWKNTINMLY